MTVEEEIKHNMDLYYITKQRCNYTTDPDEILKIWNEAQSYWDRAEKLKHIKQ